MPIPVCIPEMPTNALKYVQSTIEKNWISALCLDEEVNFLKKLEEGFAAYVGVRHGITVTSGTAALHLAAAALKLGPGDEVIVPAMTIISTANCAIYCGARPVFVDADPQTWCLDTGQLEAAITDRTKAVIPVHIYGYPAEMDVINELAAKYGLAVIEDAAEAIGTRYRGRMVGGLGDLGTFSFYANKLVTSGEGGLVVTDNDELAARVALLKDLAFGTPRFIHEDIGFNFRMNNLTAAYAYASFEEVEQSLAKRVGNARRYSELLADIDGIQLPPASDEIHTNSYWMYGILIDPKRYGRNKGEVRELLKKEYGIDSRDFFYPLHKQPALLERGYASPEDSFPVAETLWDRGLYLPSSNNLKDEQIQFVAKALKELRQ